MDADGEKALAPHAARHDSSRALKPSFLMGDTPRAWFTFLSVIPPHTTLSNCAGPGGLCNGLLSFLSLLPFDSKGALYSHSHMTGNLGVKGHIVMSVRNVGSIGSLQGHSSIKIKRRS